MTILTKSVFALGILPLFWLTAPAAAAQKKFEVRVFSVVRSAGAAADCKIFVPGVMAVSRKPEYPPEAKNQLVGGTVEINVKTDGKGKITEVGDAAGNQILLAAARAAAGKVVFSPSKCDGADVPVSAVILYNFVPTGAPDKYFTPNKIEDFTDIRKDSELYETLLDLTENYKIAFGYDDVKFHADAPLTAGDFAHFLRLTLDLVSERAKIAGKLPRTSNLFTAYNPQMLKSAEAVADADGRASAESVKTLLLKYDIALLGDQNKFRANEPLTLNETLAFWTAIFGAEAMPVNFTVSPLERKLISRGEFALFLQESLGILSYKVLP